VQRGVDAGTLRGKADASAAAEAQAREHCLAVKKKLFSREKKLFSREKNDFSLKKFLNIGCPGPML
jgi:hypothetical protein